MFVGFVYNRSLGLDHVRTMNADLKTEGKGRLCTTGPTHRTLLDLLYYKTRTSLNFSRWKCEFLCEKLLGEATDGEELK